MPARQQMLFGPDGRPIPSMRGRGATGLDVSGGYVFDEKHRKLRGKDRIRSFRQMADNDAICGSVWYAMTTLIEGAERTVQAASDEPIAEFYADKFEECLGDMQSTMQAVLSEVLTMIWAGFAVMEPVWKLRRGPEAPLEEMRSKYDDGLVGVSALEPRAQDTIERWDFDRRGRWQGLYQYAPPHWRNTFLERSQVLHFATTSQRSNPEGRSLFRNAYRSWYFLTRIEELEAIGIERDMTGVLVFELPAEYLDPNADSDTQTQVNLFRKMLERAKRGEGDGFLIPSETDVDNQPTGFRLRQMQAGGRKPMDTDLVIKRLQSRIALSLLGESVLLGMQGSTGSWALSSDKTHLFALSLKALMTNVAAVINEQLVPQWMRFNGFPHAAQPTFAFGDIETDDATAIMTSLSQGVASSLITPTPAIEEYLLTRMGVPYEDASKMSQGQVQDALGRMEEADANGGPARAAAAQESLRQVVPITQDANPIEEAQLAA